MNQKKKSKKEEEKREKQEHKQQARACTRSHIIVPNTNGGNRVNLACIAAAQTTLYVILHGLPVCLLCIMLDAMPRFHCG